MNGAWPGGVPENGTGEAGRLLLVDDSPFFLSLLVPLLRAEGYDVTASLDGRQALECLRDTAEPFDAVVSDIDMPRMDGFELARRVREIEGCERLPLIALTSRDRDEDRALGEDVGFDRYLLKFDQAEVLTALRDAVHGATDDADVSHETLEEVVA